jgi:hypothetical protein
MPSPPEPAASTPAEPLANLGVLFVHGIGETGRGDTLRRFGEPIYAWLDSWRAAEPGREIVVDDTSLVLPHLDEPEAPAHTRLAVSWTDEQDLPHKRVWIGAEAWWAREFAPPPFTEIASWSMAMAPGVLVRFARQSLPGSRWFRAAAGYLAAIVFQVLLMILVIIGMIPRLRGFVAGIQTALIGYLRDAYIMIASAIRYSAMLTRVEREIAWLRRHCDQIAIVAHSQGAGISLRALERNSEKVSAFVTFGCPIRKLHAATVIQTESRRLGLAIAFNSAAVAFFVAAITLDIVDIGFLRWGSEGWYWIAGIFALSSTWIVTRLSAHRLDQIGYPDLSLDRGSDPPLIWRDFWAKADPVPDQGLGLPDFANQEYRFAGVDLRSTEVINRGSLIKDHSLYPENQEEFVGPVFRLLAERVGLPLPDQLDDELRKASDRRKLRVSRLSRAWWISTAGAALLVLLSSARRDLVDLGRPIQDRIVTFADWLGISFLVKYLNGDHWVPGTVGVLVIVGLATVWYRVAVFQSWRIWDKSASDVVAARLFRLPVSFGPSTLLFVRKAPGIANNELDLRITREFAPDREPTREDPPFVYRKKPKKDADLDRRNGIALFFLATMCFPIALIVMSLLDLGETEGGWVSPTDWWAAPSLLWLIVGLLTLAAANLFLGQDVPELWTTTFKRMGAWLRAAWSWVRTVLGRRDAPAESV